MNGKVAWLGQIAIHPRRPAKFLVVASFDSLVPSFNRVLQDSWIHLQVLSQILNRVAMNDQTNLVVEFNGLGMSAHTLVKDQIGTVFWQSGNRF